MDTTATVRTRKKLIEVALPLDAINAASVREKSIRHGHPSTLHLWWARRPLAAARAVIFAQMVDDPSGCPDIFPTKAEQEEERKRLFGIIEALVKWENTNNEEVLEQARAEIRKSWQRTCADNAGHPRAKELFDPDKLPAFHDPFAGGGSLPLEAQRLGLEAYASDLNPVAVLINKAMIEIPPKFAGLPPVNPEARRENRLVAKKWQGAQGLAEDVRYYGKWMRGEAEKRIGHLYPKVEITAEMAKERSDLEKYVGQQLKVIAWIWARTVKSPNPAFAHVDVPLASTFMLSTKKGKEAYVEPIVESDSYRFTVKVGKPKDAEAAKNGTKLGRGADFRCLLSGTPISGEYIKAEGKAGHLGARMMAIVAEGERERVYLPPTSEHDLVAKQAEPRWVPAGEVPPRLTGGTCVPYGLTEWGDLFTARQLVALTTFSELVQEVRGRVVDDAIAAGINSGGVLLGAGETWATAYADAVAVYLSFALSKQTDLGNSLCRWEPIAQCPRQLFGRQAIPMVWDYAEGNPLGSSSGSWIVFIDGIYRAFVKAFELSDSKSRGSAQQSDARTQRMSSDKIISTDPPYYDNISYADLSDFFYVWFRRSLRSVFPDLLATLAVPKADELFAGSYRHGGVEQAESFFLDGMTKAIHQLAEQTHPSFPVTIYYAFKQSETERDETTCTGWEAFLDAVVRSGFALSGTWAIRTENRSRMVGQGTNALASSIVLVCRPRPADAPIATRREFLAALRAELPTALLQLQRSNIAPVDLAQAAIGPGMAVYTRYSKILDAEGSPLPVGEALALINQTLDEVLAEQEGDFDADTRWALAWFEQLGFDEGEFGVAETLSKAKNTSIAGMAQAGILTSKAGSVRLLRPDELREDWDPASGKRATVWECVHHLVRILEAEGESAAAELVAQLGSEAEIARELAYRLYTICERKKRAREALSYNALVQSWPEIMRLASENSRRWARGPQATLFPEDEV